MNFTEQVFRFECSGQNLLGIIANPVLSEPIGILVVVGGPQYRVGSHRQFLLLSRALATAGYPVMRFDHGGMGDSSGEPVSFEALNDNIAAAVSAFQQQCPAIKRLVLWGLCDAASASLLYWHASRDARIAGLTLLNPWVRSETTLARTQVKHYYGQRLLQREFWSKLLTGKLGVATALGGFINKIRLARQSGNHRPAADGAIFQTKMAEVLKQFPGKILLILSGDDYTAKEFREYANSDPAWRGALNGPEMTTVEIAEADHTFSSSPWRGAVEAHTLAWLNSLSKSA